MEKYTIVKNEFNEMIKRNNEDGSTSFIPIDLANSDYQAYLKRDEAEQSTPSVIDEA
jgi:hypothetical protein